MINAEKAGQLTIENSFMMKEISQEVENAAKNGQNNVFLEKRFDLKTQNFLRYLGYCVEETEQEIEEYSDLRKEYFSRFVNGGGTLISW